jgi:trehalose 6-phosphate synthase/phosphatase
MPMESRLTGLSALAGGADRVRGGLIVASNREPYSHRRTGRGITVEVPTGGLVSAMDTVLRHTGGTWVAWGSGSADRQGADAAGRVAVPPGDPRYTLRRVWLSARSVANYYHGFANRVLWPLFHGEPDRGFFRERYWDEYVLANRAFAAAILEEGGDDATVWVHDYHLCLVPRMIRAAKPARTIAHFWHIPWPDPELFRLCPHGAELVAGLLGNDLIGFQIPLHARNFLACAQACPGAHVDHRAMTVTLNGRTTHVKAFPISIDYRRFDSLSASPETAERMARIREELRLPSLVGIGVDRLDFSKALIQRFQAIDLLFRRYRSLRGKFTFIQVAVMTRSGEPYLSYRREVEALIVRINQRYARDGWQPIIYRDRPLDSRDLVACYRMADAAVVSPLCDGMNLVAKEYAASKGDGEGVLVLSRHAGAAAELAEALLIDPCDIEGVAKAIHTALTMSRRERRTRMECLRKRVREHTIYHWIGDILHELALVPFIRSGRFRHALGHWPEIGKRIAGRELFLCLDFDGTLAPIVERPELAEMPEEIRALLVFLKDRCTVVILSGRSLADIRARVGIPGLIYGGNHGAELEMAGKSVPGLPDDRPLLEEFLARAGEELARFPGVLIEDKGVTASVHFRLVNPSHLAGFTGAFRELSRHYRERLRITEGRKVFEVRPRGARGKGEALGWVMEAAGRGRMPVYIGDDTSDEDAFRAIRGKGISVSVGGSPEAEYSLGKQGEVREFLELLAAARLGANRQEDSGR